MSIPAKRSEDDEQREAYTDASANTKADQTDRSGSVDTGLVGWSWTSSSKSPSHYPQRNMHGGRLVGVATDAAGESSAEDQPRSRRQSLGRKSSRKSVKVQDTPFTEPPHKEEPTVNDEIVSRRRATDPESQRPPGGGLFKTSPRGLSPQSSGIGKQTRRRLLGNRKLSNLPVEEERFKEHRDSLMLAHQRLFREDGTPIEPEEETSTQSKGKQKAMDNTIESSWRTPWSKPQPFEHAQDQPPGGESPDLPGKQNQAVCLQDDVNTATKLDAARRGELRSMQDSQFGDSRPINSVATMVRSPSRGVPKDAHPDREGHWLSLSEEAHERASSTATSQPTPAIPHHLPGPVEAGSGISNGFLSLAPAVHEPAPRTVNEPVQEQSHLSRPASSSGTTLNRGQPRRMHAVRASKRNKARSKDDPTVSE